MNDTFSDHEELVRSVMALVTRDRILEALIGWINIASPTGSERTIAEWAVDHLGGAGLDNELQVIDDSQANAVGVLPGRGDGPNLLLYAPTDTFTTGESVHDVPWASSCLRSDMVPNAQVFGDYVTGLAAGNPKGHAAAIMVAIEAMALAGVHVSGDVIAGFGAGGMPSFSIPGIGTPGRENTGHGVGASFLLERGYTPDYGVIAKPGWSVSHEEVGLVWIDIEVPGTHTYVGSRHRIPYQNAATLAATVITRIEAWLEEYAAQHEVGTMRPQGIVSSVHGGFERLAASTSASVRLRLDLRMTPEQTAPEVVREVRGQLAVISEDLGVDLKARQIATVPGSRTDQSSPVVRATVNAWESVSGTPHSPITGNSGATDANILRSKGVPTARVGMPKVTSSPDGGPVDFSLGMNIADLRDISRLVEVLVRTTINLNDSANNS